MALFIQILQGPTAEQAQPIMAVSDPEIARSVLRTVQRSLGGADRAGAPPPRIRLVNQPVPVTTTLEAVDTGASSGQQSASPLNPRTTLGEVL